ncbi:MAG: hypothetical protein WCJ29_01910 [bacterium]
MLSLTLAAFLSLPTPMMPASTVPAGIIPTLIALRVPVGLEAEKRKKHHNKKRRSK